VCVGTSSIYTWAYVCAKTPCHNFVCQLNTTYCTCIHMHRAIMHSPCSE
jgi:hypothetical protein